MKSCHQTTLVSLLFSFAFTCTFAQDQRAFNQNASRSNRSQVFNQNDSRSNRGLSLSFSPVYSTATNTGSDSLLFRGNGAGFRLGADYFFGKAGISFSSGFGSSSADDAVINNFLKSAAIPPDQLLITKTRQQNMYMLLGPSVRFGNMVELYAHAKGGLFINNSGLVSIQQRGAQRAAYRNESTGKTIYPGFLTGVSVQYKTRSDIWSFGIGADYMNTRSEVNNYDVRRGGGMEALKLSGNINDIVTGITVRYNILSPRDHASGQSTGKRQLGKPKYEDIKVATREAGSGMATGKRTYQPGQPQYGNITTAPSCGTVTSRVTHPDGTTEEMVFACPEDAAQYNRTINNGMPNRISMNVTTPKQTQGATFGEKVKTGMPPGDQHDPAARTIISGRLTWVSSNSAMGIVTNRAVRGGSVTMNSQTSSTRQTNQSSFGTLVRISAREAGSGLATGKRSREAGSGMATGRRQYEPIFSEGEGDVCNPCLATAKMSSANTNPLYNDKGLSGNNPLYQGRAKGDDDCDGIAGVTVSLVEPASRTVIATTTTESCGDFFFANVPEGNYVVKLTGSFIGKKGYDVYLKSKTDLLGKAEQNDASMQLLINTGDNDGMVQKAGISTSRSNIRTKSLAIIEADLDGDGEFESLKATATFSDGSTRDISSDPQMKTVSNASGTKGIVLNGDAFQMNRRRGEVLKSDKQGDPGANRITSITISGRGGKLTATGTFSDGSTRDITESLEINTAHPGIKQYNITFGDSDDDGIADAVIKTKTKSNQSNDRMIAGQDNAIPGSQSDIKVLRLVAGDVNGDGTPEMSVAAPFVPGGAVVSAAMHPGDPIPGLDVKLVKNPGGQSLQNNTTNANGEFEFTNLEAGDYTFIIEQEIIIDDETYIVANTRGQDHNSSRSNKTASVINNDNQGDGNAKVQDHNSSRSNKSASVTNGNQDNGNTKAQDHNSSRSNKSASAIDTDANDDETNTGPGKWMAPESLKRSVSNSRNNIRNILTSLDALEEQLDTEVSIERRTVNTTRSNIKNQRIAIYELREALANMEFIEKETAMNDINAKMMAMNTRFQVLQESVNTLGRQFTSISNVLKTKHDIAMNSIRNMK